MPTIREVTAAIEQMCPLSLQESWDNSGLQVGDPHAPCTGALLAVEATEATVQEAVSLGYNLLITHHPLLFHPLKRISTGNFVERTVAAALQNNVAIYASHTAADNNVQALNGLLANRLSLQNCHALLPAKEQLIKLEVMVPATHAEQLKEALFAAGAGRQGDYEGCCFSADGQGQFTPRQGASPFLGTVGKPCVAHEQRISSLVYKEHLSAVIKALHQAHPYEEPAYDILPLLNSRNNAGSGLVGSLPEPLSPQAFIQLISLWPHVENVAHSHTHVVERITQVAICSGSGGSFLEAARRANCQVLLTGEAKYNHYLDAAGMGILLVTIGHFESETVARDIFAQCISAKIPNFAHKISTEDTNPVHYYQKS